MKYLIICITIALFAIFPGALQAQSIDQEKLDSIFNQHGEVYFKFQISDAKELSTLTRIISIDHVKGKEVHAYANRNEFADFLRVKTSFQILKAPGTLLSKLELNPYSGIKQPGERTLWDFYPTYEQYVGYMVGFANDHPDLCHVDTVGVSIQGRLILTLKISDNVNLEEAEPQFLYTSSIHGDEITGYVLMLHLIDYLLTNYGIDPEITNLINTTEIFINPLANPDGTYHGGNNSVYGAVRYNANSIDLNRNYPDPKMGQHPDYNDWQVETIAWMDYATNNDFTMSANFHGGAEVFNYPWDTWSKLAADDDWWQFVGREWADTVHEYGPSGYFTFMDNGVTNGNVWYEINGGRQDYMNYWHHCREVTVEISDIKTLPVSQLIPFWNYNYRSFINFMQQANFGFNGIITDTVTDQPVAAKIFIQGHDKDFSEVYSKLPSGFYARPIYEGIYDVTVSAPGYFTKTIKNVPVTKWTTTPLDIQLRPLTFDAQDKVVNAMLVYPNPSDGRFRLVLPETPVHPSCSVQVLNMMGNIVFTQKLNPGNGQSAIEINTTELSQGLYFLKFNTGYRIYLDKLIIRK